jgi:aminoglycoside/choline kinase family phosphotransferase
LGKLAELELGLTVLGVESLPSGLGLRRFYRLRTSGRPASLIARVEAQEDPAGRPAGAAAEPPLEPLRTFLADLGLPVPRRFGGNASRGVDWLEDFGDRTLADVAEAATARERHLLYAAILDWLPPLQAATEAAQRLPTYRRRLDRALLAYKGELFTSRSLPLALGRDLLPEERKCVAEAFAHIADEVEAAPLRLAHRDLQSQNILVREPAASGAPRLGLIDFQGAFLAPPEYDIVSLLRDSYVEISDDEVESHLQRIRPRLPDRPDPETFRRRFDLLTLARKGKDHARFVYAQEERGDDRWAEHLPRTARALRGAADRVAGLDVSFARLAEWIRLLPGAVCEE